LSIVQTTSVIEGRSFVLDTLLLHTSGEWISGQLYVPLVKEDPQGLGSAMTYARRYSLMAMVGICPEDDDGESATKREAKPVVKKEEPKQEADKSLVDLQKQFMENWHKFKDPATGEAFSSAKILKTCGVAKYTELNLVEADKAMKTYVEAH